MTRRIFDIVAVVTASVVGTGCASTKLTVERVTSKTPQVQGIRYSLPKPFLVMKPNAAGDGTFTVDLVFLPNEDETFAISGLTKRGKYSLNVETKDGLLKKIVWSAEGTSEVDAAIAKSAAELAKSAIDKREADEKKAEDERLAAEKSAAAEAKAAQEAVDAKALALKLAELEVASVRSALSNPPSMTPAEREAIRQAELKRDQANAALLDAQAKLARVQSGGAAANLPGGLTASSTPPAFERFWGPVIYEIRDTGSSVDLVPVAWREATPPHQARLETNTAKPPVQPPSAAQGGGNPVTAVTTTRAGGGAVIRLTLSKPVKALNTALVTLMAIPAGTITAEEPTVAIVDGGRVVALTYATLAKGEYSLIVHGTNIDGTALSAADVKVTVP